MYKIKPVKSPEDHAHVYQLHKQTFPGDSHVFVHEGWWWLVWHEDEERPVAFCGMHESSQYRGEAGYLVRSGVLQAHRGRGLQRLMLRTRETKARREGFWVVITTTHTNPPSANNLIAAGYTQYIPKVQYGATGTDYWLKVLNKHDPRCRRNLND